MAGAKESATKAWVSLLWRCYSSVFRNNFHQLVFFQYIGQIFSVEFGAWCYYLPWSSCLLYQQEFFVIDHTVVVIEGELSVNVSKQIVMKFSRPSSIRVFVFSSRKRNPRPSCFLDVIIPSSMLKLPTNSLQTTRAQPIRMKLCSHALSVIAKSSLQTGELNSDHDTKSKTWIFRSKDLHVQVFYLCCQRFFFLSEYFHTLMLWWTFSSSSISRLQMVPARRFQGVVTIFSQLVLDCLVHEMLLIRERKPKLNTQSDSLRAKLFI